MTPQLSLPIWALLGFALWTVLLLLFTVGSYRLGRLFSGKAKPADFKADKVEGSDFYRRSMRAHANCVENLPVFGVIVFVLHSARIGGAFVDGVAMAILVGRLVQSTVHVSLEQTNVVALVRFAFFMVQILGYFSLIFVIVSRAL